MLLIRGTRVLSGCWAGRTNTLLLSTNWLLSISRHNCAAGATFASRRIMQGLTVKGRKILHQDFPLFSPSQGRVLAVLAVLAALAASVPCRPPAQPPPSVPWHLPLPPLQGRPRVLTPSHHTHGGGGGCWMCVFVVMQTCGRTIRDEVWWSKENQSNLVKVGSDNDVMCASICIDVHLTWDQILHLAGLKVSHAAWLLPDKINCHSVRKTMKLKKFRLFYINIKKKTNTSLGRGNRRQFTAPHINNVFYFGLNE